jgi:hypothetical protein
MCMLLNGFSLASCDPTKHIKNKNRFESNPKPDWNENQTQTEMKIKVESKCKNWKVYHFLSNLCGNYAITVSSIADLYVFTASFLSWFTSFMMEVSL